MTSGPSEADASSGDVAAALERAAIYAADIVKGTRSPIDGARRIWWDCFNPAFDDYLEGNDVVDTLAAFVGLADDWEEQQDDEAARAEIEANIRSAAEQYLQGWQPHSEPGLK